MARDEPALTQGAIGSHFGGLSSASVSLILSGKRGKQNRHLAIADGELEAMRLLMAVLTPLGAAARRRVVEYAIERLSEQEAAPAKISIVTEGHAV